MDLIQTINFGKINNSMAWFLLKNKHDIKVPMFTIYYKGKLLIGKNF